MFSTKYTENFAKSVILKVLRREIKKFINMYLILKEDKMGSLKILITQANWRKIEI